VTGAGLLAVMLELGGRPAAECSVTKRGSDLQLAITLGSRRWQLNMPADWTAATIAISEGRAQVLPERLLPAGIMPHGPDGVGLIEKWDRSYRGGRRPPWDSDVPDRQLVEVVESGLVKPCRAVELGCGSGTDAVYLASKGFEVTAIDLAPTALNIARAKAARAGVSVRWLLADVLRPPQGLGPFEFLFDSGCYHGVRRTDPAGYVETVNKLSRPGTLLLIIAGNANEPRHYGPPRVDEPELVGDFAKSWDFVLLRELRRPQGAWFWSILLRRRP
jgi:SAM-dependent methyltransferase